MSTYELREDCQIPGLANIYLDNFGYIYDGTFVEVGAYDGESFSNTCALADLGWTGIYIEPIPEYAARCRNRHIHSTNTKVVEFGVAASECTVDMWVGGVLSTASEKAYKNFMSIDWAKGCFKNSYKQTVKMKTLETILEENHIKKNFEVLVIDVEGYEWETIRNFDIKKWSPRMVIIELHDTNPNYSVLKEECDNIVKYFEENDYKPVYKDTTNTVYVKRSM